MNSQQFIKSHSNTSFLLFSFIIIIFATILRTPLTSVGPIVSIIREDLGISNVIAGFLTTIPLITFAIVSMFAPKISNRFGMEHTLFYSIVIIALGMIIRSIGNLPTLILGTVFIGIGIAFGNVLIPSLFKLKFPLQIGLLTGFYTVSMNVSAGLAMGVSPTIATNKFGWEGALISPIILTIITLIFWTPLLKGNKVDVSTFGNNSINKRKNLITSPLAWMITLAAGLQSLLFYCTVAWLPEILISQGFSTKEAGLMTSLMQYSQIPMTFLIPILAEKFSSQKSIVYMFTILYVIGFSGIFFEWTQLNFLWMICIGLAGGASFGLVLMLFTLRTKTAYEAAQISGFSQSFGYLLAAIGPVLFGYLHDTTNSWHLPNLLFIITSILLCIFALYSARDKYI